MEVIQLSLFGKMFPERSVQTAEKTSAPCWKNLPAWNNQTLQFLDLRGGGKWSKAGAIAGNGWSLAWRQLDSQYFGVPQRRKRIALVVDFAGERAGEILFERESLPGHPDQSIPTWQEVARTAGNRPAGNDRMVGQQGGQAYTLKIRSGCAGGGKGALVQTEKTGTLSTLQDQTLFQPVYCLAGNIIDRSETAGANGSGVKENQSYTLNTVDRPAVAYKVFDARGNGDGKTVQTITGDHESRVTDYTAIITERQTFSEQSYSYYKKSDKCSTMKAKAGNVGNGSECLIAEKAIHWIVRRLTTNRMRTPARLPGRVDGHWRMDGHKREKAQGGRQPAL